MGLATSRRCARPRSTRDRKRTSCVEGLTAKPTARRPWPLSDGRFASSTSHTRHRAAYRRYRRDGSLSQRYSRCCSCCCCDALSPGSSTTEAPSFLTYFLVGIGPKGVGRRCNSAAVPRDRLFLCRRHLWFSTTSGAFCRLIGRRLPETSRSVLHG